MTSTVLAQITDELGTNLSSDRELHLIKSAHRIIEKNLSINSLTDRNDVYHRYVHRLMSLTFVSLEKNNADVRLAAESYYEHILKAYECFGFPETSLKILAMSIEKMTGARQVTKVVKYLLYYLEILPKQLKPDKNGRTTYQEVVRTLLLRSLEINQTVCHQALEKSCDRLISSVIWLKSDLKEIGEKALHKIWTTKGHASRTMAALEGAVILEAKEDFRKVYCNHIDKVIHAFVNNQVIPVGAISLIKKCLADFVKDVSVENLQSLVEMFLLMIRDSSNEIAYDAFAALEELVRVGTQRLDGFIPGAYLREKYGVSTPETEVTYECTSFVDPLVNADLYEQLQETKPPQKVDLTLEPIDQLIVGEKTSVDLYVAAFLSKTFLLTGLGNLLKTDRQSKDSMKILAIRVLNVICAKESLEKFVVRVGEKSQHLVDIIEFSTSSDDQLSQQAIKFAFTVLEHESTAIDIIATFKSVKNQRYLLDSFNLNHVSILEKSELLEFLFTVAFRPLLDLKTEANLPELTSSCRFVGIIREWMLTNKKCNQKMNQVVMEFHEHLQKFIFHNWDNSRLVTIIPTLFNLYESRFSSEDQYPPSLPLRLNNLPRKQNDSIRPANYFESTPYDDWRATIFTEAVIPNRLQMMSLFRETSNAHDYTHEKIPQFCRMQWSLETLPSLMQIMCISLADSPTKEESHQGFQVGMAVLNWVYRNVFIVRGAAETKEFPFLQHSRVEMDDSLGNRSEFRATLDAFYRTVQSSADEKLDQLLTPTVDLITAALMNVLKVTTENIIEIIVYIKILFTLSPISAVKLLHVLLRSLLDPKLVESLTTKNVIHYENCQKTFKNDSEDILRVLQYTGTKTFNRWGDDVDIEKTKMGAMTMEILEHLEPLITQSLKVFRMRGKKEKEQVLQLMICLLNHKLKLSDADPTQCLMKFAVTSFSKPEECAHPELLDTLMHFLATASRFQKDEEYQTPIAAATNLMKSMNEISTENVNFVMKAVSFALMNGRYEEIDLKEILETNHKTWIMCMRNAPTETLYTMSLLLEQTETTVKNQELFWTVFSNWANENHENVEKVPFAAVAYPLSIICEYLVNQIEVFKIIDTWVDTNATENIFAKCSLIAVMFFSKYNKLSQEDWKKYFEYAWKYGCNTQPIQLLICNVAFFQEMLAATEVVIDEELVNGESVNLLEELMTKHTSGSYQDLCHTIICLGEKELLEFVNVLEQEHEYDDTMWGLLMNEFRRIEDDPEHRLDISYRLQDFVESLVEQFHANTFLKVLANVKNDYVNLSSLKLAQVELLLNEAKTNMSENGYVLRGVCSLLAHPHTLYLISEKEMETAQMFVKLAEKLTGIDVNDTLIASYHKFRIDFSVKGDIDPFTVKEIKKFVFHTFVLCQEANRRSTKGFTKSQSACFRHPILNSIFNIPIVAMECFNWIPVIEIHKKPKPTISCLPPTGHLCDVIVLEDMGTRLAKVGLVTSAQFEVLFTTMQAVIASTVIGPEKSHHDEKEVLERESRSCKALQLYIATILTSMKYPNGGDPSSGFVLKSSYPSELFLQSSEYVHLCNLKSAFKSEPRTAFTAPLERFEGKTWTKFDGNTQLYGICQTPLFSLWQLCGMMPIEFKQHANYHRVDHSASNYFLTSATNIDTISNVKQLMNIFEYWYSQGISELSEQLLHSILHTILHLSDFFDDPDLHRAVLRTTSIIYRHSYDQNPFLSSFVVVMFLKSISVLGADMNSSEFKQGEPEAIAQKLVTFGLASDVKAVRIHTLAGLLYLVQSDSLESFSATVDVLSGYLEKFLKVLANGSGRVESDECQFFVALTIKLLEVPIRLKQEKPMFLKLLLASVRVRRDRFLIELIAEGIEQLLCRSNEFNVTVTNFLLAGIESGDPTPFPTDNEHYCRVAYRILMVAATRAKVANDEMAMTRIYKALQKLGFELLSRGETAPAIVRTLPFFSICVNGIENTIIRYTEAFVVNGDDKDSKFVTTLINQIIETAATSKKWSVELKTVGEKIQKKTEPLDEFDNWLLRILNKKLRD